MNMNNFTKLYKHCIKLHQKLNSNEIKNSCKINGLQFKINSLEDRMNAIQKRNEMHDQAEVSFIQQLKNRDGFL